jgi:hypothetical protein
LFPFSKYAPGTTRFPVWITATIKLTRYRRRPALPGVLQQICTIVGRTRGVDRTTKARRQRIEIDKHQRTHWKAQKRTGDALPKQVEKVIETGNALATEAKGLGRAR